ncbi:MAG TPA: DUF3293 domain-containing protein [Gallionella sp.]|nr:DUF3293 domain-containing protein [Gallionella sp.]
MSEIPPLMIKAYKDTDYFVFGESLLVLRVGVANGSLAELYKQYKTNTGVFVTAVNPFSKDVGEAVNTASLAELATELERRNLVFFEGIGEHPMGEWAAEPSYFVLGLSLEAAKDLGKKYDQNAVVWCGPDAVPELILLR